MRFPFSLVRAMAWHIAVARLCGYLRGRRRFPLVLMLEPLHACNLHCRGCGRVREYASTINSRMTLAECLEAVRECAAPTVSLCGGEPLIYPEIVPLVREILQRGRHIYLCTNGQKMAESVPLFAALPKKNRLFWNVHLDGTAKHHDAIVEADGAYAKAIEGIRAARAAGFRVYTNTTVYASTTVNDILALSEELKSLQIDGMMIAPAFGYEAVESTDFLSREATHNFFRELETRIDHALLTATPTYLAFLAGRLSLPCAAWANPTRNVCGWKSPCYLITNTHYATYSELLKKTDWEKLGFRSNESDEESGEKNYDARCEQCLMHCGFEPAAVLNVSMWKHLGEWTRWMFAARLR